jgi:hypothetical protein
LVDLRAVVTKLQPPTRFSCLLRSKHLCKWLYLLAEGIGCIQ